MDVLALDPSFSCTGAAKLIGGVVLTKQIKAQTGVGIGGIRKAVRYTTGQVLQFAPKECLTVIESPIIARAGRGGLQLERAWLFGFLVDQLMLRGPLVAVHPMTRAKYATGDGHAKKPDVVKAIRATFPDLQVPDDNIADALALLGMGARWQGTPIDGDITKDQAKAMRSSLWPNREGTEQ